MNFLCVMIGLGAIIYIASKLIPTKKRLPRLMQEYKDHQNFDVTTQSVTIYCPTQKDAKKCNEFALLYYKEILEQDYFIEL